MTVWCVSLWLVYRLLVHTEFRDTLGIAKSMDSFNEIIRDVEERCRVRIHILHWLCCHCHSWSCCYVIFGILSDSSFYFSPLSHLVGHQDGCPAFEQFQPSNLRQFDLLWSGHQTFGNIFNIGLLIGFLLYSMHVMLFLIFCWSANISHI